MKAGKARKFRTQSQAFPIYQPNELCLNLYNIDGNIQHSFRKAETENSKTIFEKEDESYKGTGLSCSNPSSSQVYGKKDVQTP